jgi:hypothetical protein
MFFFVSVPLWLGLLLFVLTRPRKSNAPDVRITPGVPLYPGDEGTLTDPWSVR